MALASLSPESRIKAALAELGCAERNFAVIAGVVGKSRFAEGMAGTSNFAHVDAARMLEIVQDMRDLQKSVGIVRIDWRDVELVQLALAVRRINRIADELKLTDAEFARLNEINLQSKATGEPA
jgi:hypothetical protein